MRTHVCIIGGGPSGLLFERGRVAQREEIGCADRLLNAAREAAGLPTLFLAADVTIHGADGDAPAVMLTAGATESGFRAISWPAATDFTG